MSATSAYFSLECFVLVLLVLGFLAVAAVVGVVLVFALRLWDRI
ncbi:hypothetical protein [Thiothrix litoralis]|nr:hypothetical protein [Thiothrix litoralis]